jgi:hypothetical protein
MARHVNVVETGKGQYGVFVSFIQRGVSYSNKEFANNQAKEAGRKENIPESNVHLLQ